MSSSWRFNGLITGAFDPGRGSASPSGLIQKARGARWQPFGLNSEKRGGSNFSSPQGADFIPPQSPISSRLGRSLLFPASSDCGGCIERDHCAGDVRIPKLLITRDGKNGISSKVLDLP